MQDIGNILDAIAPKPRPTSSPMPAFPTHVLPPSVHDYVTKAAATTRVPPEMIAVPFLAFTGGIVGPRLRFEVGPGWFERPALWIAIAALTGSGKSPAIRAARAPVDALQRQLFESWRIALHQWASTEHPITPEPKVTHLITTEVSIESIHRHLSTSGSVTLLRDELHGVIRALSRHGGDGRQKLLSLWSSEPIATKHEHTTATFIEAPVLSVIGGIQPALFGKLRSKEHDGLIERFLPLFVMFRQQYLVGTPLTAPDLAPVTVILGSLHYGTDLGQHPLGHIVLPTTEATAVWTTWYNDNVDLCRQAPLPLHGFYAKLPAHVARLALVLHCLWNPDSPTEPLSGATMRLAIELGEFFRIHIHRIMPLLNERVIPSLAKPTLRQRILRVLSETTESTGWVTRTQIHAATGRPELDTLNSELSSMIIFRQIEERTRTISGSRKPRTEYRLPRT